MAPALYTTVLNTQAIKKLCTHHEPQYTTVRKSEEEKFLVLAIFHVDGQPPLKWICGCGGLWPAKGRDFHKHLGKCPRAICYMDDKEFNEDTNDGSSTKMNAINFDTYQYLNGTPEFGMIKLGSILAGITLRYHHNYIFACASCGMRFSGDHKYDSVEKHHTKKLCKFEDKSPVTVHSWNDYQVNLNNCYQKVPAGYITDVKIQQRKDQQAEMEEAERIKQEKKKKQKTEKKKASDMRKAERKRQKIEATKQSKKAKDQVNLHRKDDDEEEEDDDDENAAEEEEEEDNENADEEEEEDDNEAVDEADDEENQSKSTTRSTRSMSTIKTNPTRRSPRSKPGNNMLHMYQTKQN